MFDFPPPRTAVLQRKYSLGMNERTNCCRLVSSATSEGDLRQLRKELEKDFKRAMAANVAKQQRLLQGDKVRPSGKWAPH